MVLVVDNGWAAAAQWSARTFLIERLIAEAEGQSRPVMIVPTANATRSISLKVEAPTLARSTATALQPQPFAPDRMARRRGVGCERCATRRNGRLARRRHRPRRPDDGDFAERLQELAGGGFSVVDTRPGCRGARHFGRRRRRRTSGSAGAARRGRITRWRPARGIGARPASGRDGLHAGRRRDARARPPSTCRSSSGTR